MFKNIVFFSTAVVLMGSVIGGVMMAFGIHLADVGLSAGAAVLIAAPCLCAGGYYAGARMASRNAVAPLQNNEEEARDNNQRDHRASQNVGISRYADAPPPYTDNSIEEHRIRVTRLSNIPGFFNERGENAANNVENDESVISPSRTASHPTHNNLGTAPNQTTRF